MQNFEEIRSRGYLMWMNEMSQQEKNDVATENNNHTSMAPLSHTFGWYLKTMVDHCHADASAAWQFMSALIQNNMKIIWKYQSNMNYKGLVIIPLSPKIIHM